MLEVLLLAAAATVKLQPLTATLFESVEMAKECLAAQERWAEYERKTTERHAAKRKIEHDYVPAPKPVSDTTDEEVKAWRAARAERARKLAEFERCRGFQSQMRRPSASAGRRPRPSSRSVPSYPCSKGARARPSQR
jgi:hypothetical protein